MSVEDIGDSEAKEVLCPYCAAGAVYKYGKIKSGKQRYFCILCGRQFTPDARRVIPHERPFCPVCGRMMHVYKKEFDALRFRCAGYPDCRMYVKIPLEKEAKDELLSA